MELSNATYFVRYQMGSLQGQQLAIDQPAEGKVNKQRVRRMTKRLKEGASSHQAVDIMFTDNKPINNTEQL